MENALEKNVLEETKDTNNNMLQKLKDSISILKDVNNTSADTENNEQIISEQFPKFNDELESWLKFNDRVINEASRSRNPILERLNFIGIADSNLDEFIRTKPNAYTYKKLIHAQTARIEEIYEELLNELREKHSINITKISNIKDNQKAYSKLKREFKKNIYPLIQPLIVTNELPLPIMTDGGSFIASKLDDERGANCIIKLPEARLIKIKGISEYKQTYVLIEDVVEEFIQDFYRGKHIIYNSAFRILRKIESLNADNSDYVSGIKRQIKNRESASIQLLDVVGKTSDYLKFLPFGTKKRKRKYVYGLSYLKSIKDIVSYTDDMVFDKARPRVPISFISESMFDTLTDNDVLVHYPYESFDMSAVRLIEEAANDDNVLSIKQTLYRVGQDSPLIDALIKAATNGKQVVVLLELKAKMDEENNLELTEKLKSSGCNVIFGPLRIKTHAKITLIIRQEKDKIAKYVNISTGNFNDKTAKIYEDLSYFVKERSKLKIGTDLCDLFNYLGGCSNLSEMNDLLISPETFRSGIEKEIDNCIKSKIDNPDKDVTIRMKCNSFTDKRIGEKLYEASSVGVKVSLIVRGMCIVKPGIKGLSENIEVISIIGRYLEHSRIYEFSYIDENGKNVVKPYIGSGDMMPRNLDHRVEVIVPIRTAPLKAQISDIFNSYFTDNTNSYRLLSNGEYLFPTHEGTEEDAFSVQENYIKTYKKLEKSIIH